MSSLKLVKDLYILAVVCVVMAQINGNRVDEEEEPDATGETRIVYDQRQSGKYNIHVVIKDVAIIEMDQNEITDNYNDEEYYYDEGDLTIKPINLKPTTTSNSTATTTNPAKSTSSKVTTIPSPTIIYSTESPNTESTLISQHEMTTLSSSILWNTLITTTISSSKAPNIVDLNTKPAAIDIKPRSKIEPIYAIEEPVLHRKHHLLDYNYGMPPQAQFREGSESIETTAQTLTNSKIYKVKLHRSHQPHHFTAIRAQTRRCRSNQYRDPSGNCRGKRSSSGSILKRLLSMLVTLPFVRGEQDNED